jgi:hypothetical protein
LGSIYQNLIKMMFLDILHLKMEILQCLVGWWLVYIYIFIQHVDVKS